MSVVASKLLDNLFTKINTVNKKMKLIIININTIHILNGL